MQKAIHWFDNHLRQVNRLLLVAILIINGYILLRPVAPAVQFQITKYTTKPVNIHESNELANIDRNTNHLLIPSLRLDKPIVEGNDPNVLFQGVWRRPNTSTPDKGSNTVLAGHRFGYRPEMGTFYNLDKVKTGDEIIAVWGHEIYVYKVYDIRVVHPEDVYVENPSTDRRITLYTCTPIWSAKDRLVVSANLEQVL